MKAQPLVSILTPSFNQARYIGDCVASVANQTYRPIEHIIMDGGSLDGTTDVLKAAPDHVRWLSESDNGQSHALNKALAASTGDIIGWVNSDDGYADRRAIEWAVEGLRDADVVFGHALLINETNDILQVLAALPFSETLVRAVHYPVQPTFFFRREALEAAGFVHQDLRYVMDRDLMLRLSKTCRVKHLGRVIAVDRHQADRKVLSQSYLDEAARHDRSLGIENGRQRSVTARVVRTVLRLQGIPLSLRLGHDLDPAFGLNLSSAAERLSRQCFVKRQDMPFRTSEAHQ